MKAYPKEFRGEVLAACDGGEGTHAVVMRFKVSGSWVRRIQQQRRETGQVAPKKGDDASAEMGGVGGLAGGEDRRQSGHLSARVAGRSEAGTRRDGVPDDDLPYLSSPSISLEKENAEGRRNHDPFNRSTGEL